MIRHVFISLILATVLANVQLAPVGTGHTPEDLQTKTPIKHLVVIMQENHTFDNYFGTYPGADGLPKGLRMVIDPENPDAGYVEPWHIGNNSIADPGHNRSVFDEQYNDGKMNGFISALNNRKQNGQIAMGYYDDRDIPYYWNLADNYVLFDRFFSSAKDGSFSNHLYWVAGIPAIEYRGEELADRLVNTDTIFDRLHEANISWKFYVENYDPTITYKNLGDVGNRASQVVWVPLLNFDRFLDDPNLSSNIVDLRFSISLIYARERFHLWLILFHPEQVNTLLNIRPAGNALSDL